VKLEEEKKELCPYHNAPMGGLFIGHLLHAGLSLSSLFCLLSLSQMFFHQSIFEVEF